VTWTLKYSRAHGWKSGAFHGHYQRAEIDASLGADGGVEFHEPRQRRPLAIHAENSLAGRAIRHMDLRWRSREWHGAARSTALQDGDWKLMNRRRANRSRAKEPGLQGPLMMPLPGLSCACAGPASPGTQTCKLGKRQPRPLRRRVAPLLSRRASHQERHRGDGKLHRR